MNILLIVNQQKDKNFELANKIIESIDNRASVFVCKDEKSDLLKNVKYISDEEYKNMDLFLVLAETERCCQFLNLLQNSKFPLLE